MVVDVFNRGGVITVVSASLGRKRHDIVLKLFNGTLVTVAVGALNLGPIQISFNRTRGGSRARRCRQNGYSQCTCNIVQSTRPHETGMTLPPAKRDIDHVLGHGYRTVSSELASIYVNCDKFRW